LGDHEGSAGDGEHGNPTVTEESVNIDKCADANQSREAEGIKSPIDVWR